MNKHKTERVQNCKKCNLETVNVPQNYRNYTKNIKKLLQKYKK